MKRWQGALLVVALLDQGWNVRGLGILLGPDGCQLLPVPVFLQHENVFGVRGSGFGVRGSGFGIWKCAQPLRTDVCASLWDPA